MIALLDTNILIDSLNSFIPAEQTLREYSRASISIVTWIEVMSGARTQNSLEQTERFLAGFPRLDITPPIAAAAAGLRRVHRLKLPDAVIWATARCHNALLVTRDAKAFPESDPFVHIPYRVH